MNHPIFGEMRSSTPQEQKLYEEMKNKYAVTLDINIFEEEKMHAELIEKPLIIAICGKSAAGKDTLAKVLTKFFNTLELYAYNMVSMTTRPKRVNEVDNVDYYFVSNQEFDKAINNKELIEHTSFRGWHYGVPFSEVKPGYINIGVFNLQGLDSLRRSRYDYIIIPVYIDVKWSIRMYRSYARECKWKLEYFRRSLVDWKDFRHVREHLNQFQGRYVWLQDIQSTWQQCNQICHSLEAWKILIRDKNVEGKKIMRLGNFV